MPSATVRWVLRKVQRLLARPAAGFVENAAQAKGAIPSSDYVQRRDRALDPLSADDLRAFTQYAFLHAPNQPAFNGARKRFNLSALVNTNTLDNAIAPAASIGDSKVPLNG